MIVFCAFEQMETVIKYAEKYGFKHNIPLTFIKNYSPQVLKANMRICGATEHALLLYRERLPKFRNNGQMIFDWFSWERDSSEYPKIHPTQKPVKVLKRLIEIFTDPGDVVIDPCAGSGSTIRACMELGRNSYGFEISRDFCKQAQEKMIDSYSEQFNLFYSEQFNFLMEARKMNGYIAKVEAWRHAIKQTYVQYMVDLFILALNDPDVMGKNVLGEARLQKVVDNVKQLFDDYHTALENDKEADYYREKLDERLKKICKTIKFHPFKERYEWLKEIKYGGKRR